MDTSDGKLDSSGIKTGRMAGIAAKKTVFWPLVGAVVLPVLIGLFEPEVIRLVWQCFHWTAFYSVPVIIFGVVYMWGHSDDGFLAVF